MNAWTRRLTLPLAFVLLIAGCAVVAPPPGSSTAAPTAAKSLPATLPPSPRATVPPPAATSPTVAEIARLQGLVAADSSDADAQGDLGFALLQRVRETADPSLYAPAAVAFETARKLAPDDAIVLAGIGGLRLGKHQFAEALQTGNEAVALSPNLAAARAVVVDALVE